jgi:hypothetical protein
VGAAWTGKSAMGQAARPYRPTALSRLQAASTWAMGRMLAQLAVNHFPFLYLIKYF